MPEVISSMVLGTFLPGVAKEPGSMPAFVAVALLPPTIVSSEGPGAPCITLSWLCCTFCPPWVYLCRETHVWIKNRGSHSALFGLVFKVPTPLKAAMCALVSVSGDQDLKGTGRMWQNLWGGLIICAGGGHEHAKQRFIIAYVTKLWNTTQQGGLNLRDTTLPLFSPHSTGFVWRGVQISTGWM